MPGAAIGSPRRADRRRVVQRRSVPSLGSREHGVAVGTDRDRDRRWRVVGGRQHLARGVVQREAASRSSATAPLARTSTQASAGVVDEAGQLDPVAAARTRMTSPAEDRTHANSSSGSAIKSDPDIDAKPGSASAIAPDGNFSTSATDSPGRHVARAFEPSARPATATIDPSWREGQIADVEQILAECAEMQQATPAASSARSAPAPVGTVPRSSSSARSAATSDMSSARSISDAGRSRAASPTWRAIASRARASAARALRTASAPAITATIANVTTVATAARASRLARRRNLTSSPSRSPGAMLRIGAATWATAVRNRGEASVRSGSSRAHRRSRYSGSCSNRPRIAVGNRRRSGAEVARRVVPFELAAGPHHQHVIDAVRITPVGHLLVDPWRGCRLRAHQQHEVARIGRGGR